MRNRLTPIIRAMANPSFELTSDEASVLVSAVDDAIAQGQTFEALTIALIELIRRQLAGDDADFERCVDDGMEDDLTFIPDELRTI